ncbi:nitronate monooxygenase [Paraburkholderia steynii]|uniref:Nitronate monooxygenase n=1 Tax=Paraburkholderia steynii TaxID=1245441 RepID=A0A7Z7BI37_9BURK|nr:nitronate monooxygenase [Paraburkholderia steynii]SDJ16131.1 nitronate monooxygenase [Paraburkholderia steynii]
MKDAMTRRCLDTLFPPGRLPLMAAPMFLVSGPELAIACAKAGVVGSFPSPNARNVELLDAWLEEVTAALGDVPDAAPWALNMIVHSTYDRFDRELELIMKYQPRIVSTALGSPARVLEHVHSYGGIVMADVVTPTLARKAVDSGADALILVTHGAGGHTGYYNPFAFIAEVRQFWSGPLGLAGCITSGRDIRAAQLMGADFVVAGTRFISTVESMASATYRDLVVQSHIEDLVESKAVSGVLANWLKPSLEAAGIDVFANREDKPIDFSGDISAGKKAWKDVWSAGQGLGAIDCVSTVGEMVRQLEREYFDTLEKEQVQVSALLDGWRVSAA